MKNKFLNILSVTLTVFFCVCLVLFILTASIGVPIYFRFLYYIQIKTLKMEEATGWSYKTIKQAYDAILDYCTLAWKSYPTQEMMGGLKSSEAGASHFADCKKLFNLNLGVLLSSSAVVVPLGILDKCKVLNLRRFKGHSPYFWSAICAIGIPCILGVLIAIDFDAAFEAFHAMFFPGKDNWLFNPYEDEIINVMPEEFFMNCAIIIGVTFVAICGTLIALDVYFARKRAKNSVPEEDNAAN